MVVLHEFATLMLDSNNMSWMFKKKSLKNSRHNIKKQNQKQSMMKMLLNLQSLNQLTQIFYYLLYLPILRMNETTI